MSIDTPGPADASVTARPAVSDSPGRRLLSGLALILILIALARAGGWVFALFVSALCVLGLREFAHLVNLPGRSVSAGWLIGAGGILPLALHRFGIPALGPSVTVFFLVALALSLREGRGDSLTRAAFSGLGFVYLPVMLGHLVLLRGLELPGGDGFTAVLLVFVLTWVCDTGAYVVGSAMGRHRPWPGISPKKSVEGVIGGLVLCVGATLACRILFAPFLSPAGALGLGLLVGVACPVGDLIESMQKRRAGIKDTSRLIPGHGGILDRFDSMIVSAPLTFWVLALFT